MVIIYDKANTLSLPYTDESGAVKYVKFVPGKNEVAKEIWNAIVKYNETRMEHYCRFLRPLNEEAAGDGGIDYAKLSVKELSELIENTMDVGELGDIEKAETQRDKPRKSILKEIDKQIEAISKFEDKVNAGA
ncbi:MAG: hypothetical protein KAJ55_10600 [Anaerolineales bacterium]|nr:hypothetical protein [Anaerolineales bacterium]